MVTDVTSDCIDIKSDRDNCGGCGRACSPGLVCKDGMCVCAVYEHEKDEVKDYCGQNGCIDIAGADNDNCGACGKTCKEGQHCDKGRCQALRCERGSTMCGSYCADLRNDDADCGACGHQCTGGFRCAGGRCRP
jgi:hypothetical protein